MELGKDLLRQIAEGECTPHQLLVATLGNFELSPSGGLLDIDQLMAMNASQLEIAFAEGVQACQQKLENLQRTQTRYLAMAARIEVLTYGKTSPQQKDVATALRKTAALLEDDLQTAKGNAEAFALMTADSWRASQVKKAKDWQSVLDSF